MNLAKERFEHISSREVGSLLASDLDYALLLFIGAPNEHSSRNRSLTQECIGDDDSYTESFPFSPLDWRNEPISDILG
jgi:hypothetical protein